MIFTTDMQYTFTVPRDETEVMVSLYQKDVRDQKGLKAGAGAQKSEVTGTGENLTIGFHVMKVREGCRCLTARFRGVTFISPSYGLFSPSRDYWILMLVLLS